MTTATMFEAKTRLSELVKKAQAGETVIITSGRDKTPVAMLTGITPVQPKRLGFLEHLKVEVPDSFFFDPLAEDELTQWNEGTPDDPCNAKEPERATASTR
jgi:antitoxin (DNA-binding transcriptional repressor) of toxin-antitoxin stability system